MSINSSLSNKRNSSNIFGFLLIAAGILFLLKQFNVIEFDFEVWPLFLIAGGVISGVKNGFNRFSPIILIVMGIAFLIPHFELFDVSSEKLLFPILLIIGGIFIAFRPKRSLNSSVNTKQDFLNIFDNNSNDTTTNKENFVNIEAYFGGRKEIITSKQFSGCNATAICGGAELNLMQADNMVQPMIIDLRVMFGGIQIIVPSHWEIVNEVEVIFGGIEDKRQLRTASDSGEDKKLLLRGSVTFGALELKSY